MSSKCPITSSQSTSTVFELAKEPGGTRNRTMVRCSTCRATASEGCTPGMPPEVLAKHFTRKGWQINSKHTKAACPECQAKPSMKASAASYRGQRLMYQLLDAHYNEEKKRYDDGWSDAKVAEECELAVEVVAEARVANFGEMIPPAIVEAEREATALEKQIEQLKALVADEVVALEKKLTELQGKIAAAYANTR